MAPLAGGRIPASLLPQSSSPGQCQSFGGERVAGEGKRVEGKMQVYVRDAHGGARRRLKTHLGQQRTGTFQP